MSELRKMLRQQIEGIAEPEQPSGSARLAQHVRDWNQYEADKKAAEEAAEAEANEPERVSLVDELRGMIAGQKPASWPEVRAELDRRVEQRQHKSPGAHTHKSAVDALKAAARESEQSDGSIPLNGEKILHAASEAVNGSQAVRESVASLLYRYRDQRQ
jgi:hypothetical protein